MKRIFRSIVAFSLSAVALGVAYVPSAMATTPTETAIFQCNLITKAIFNIDSYNVSVTSSWTCAEALEILTNDGLTNISASYQSVSNSTNGNYMTFVLTNGTVSGL